VLTQSSKADAEPQMAPAPGSSTSPLPTVQTTSVDKLPFAQSSLTLDVPPVSAVHAPEEDQPLLEPLPSSDNLVIELCCGAAGFSAEVIK
jgi:hypothetical protein